jgi:hypothetical protein
LTNMKPGTNYYYVPVHPQYCIGTLNAASSSQSSLATAANTARSLATSNGADPIDSFLSEKTRILKTAIRQVLEHIAERESLRDEMVAQINDQQCDAKGRLYRVAPYGDAPLTIGDPRRRSAIEKELTDLEGEKRREMVSAWKDISTLRKELRERFIEYLEERQRQRVLQP